MLLSPSAFRVESEQQAVVRWASWGAATGSATGAETGAAAGGDIIAQAEVLSRVLVPAAVAAGPGAGTYGDTTGVTSVALLLTNRGDNALRLRVPWSALRPLTPRTAWVRAVWG